MFTPETWIILSKQLVNNWSALEDAIHLQITSNLSKGIEDGTQEWYKSQLKQIPDLQKRLSELINQQSKKINAEVVDAVKRAISLANTETIKAVEAMTGEEMGSLSLDERVLARTSEKLIDWTKGQYTVLFNQAVLKNSELVNTIKYEADLTNRGKKVASFNMRESQTRVLFDSIKRQTEESIEKGFQVIYSNGSRRSYKTYMEMNIRSTVQGIALDMMESSAGRLGIEMFLASEHADCADDHVPWQGRVFIADNVVDRWNGKYERIGVAKAAGFTTRPNCRHYWMPITEKQANNLEQTKAELRTQKGTYREKNYQDLVKQRYNERNIRKYKSRVANAEKMLTETTDPELAELLKNDIARNNQYVRAWQKRQRDLLAKNTYLKREYRRESPSKMAQDLGVSIERKLFGDRFYIVPQKINTEYYKGVFKDNFKSDDNFVLTKERKGHILSKHPEVKSYLGELINVVKFPDEVYKVEGVASSISGVDKKITNTANAIKKIEEGRYLLVNIKFTNLNNEIHPYNSIISARLMSEKSINKYKRKNINNIVYKNKKV